MGHPFQCRSPSSVASVNEPGKYLFVPWARKTMRETSNYGLGERKM